jgi:hypothetical protein
MPASPVKAALEDLLKVRRLQSEAPPLRGETRGGGVPTGVPAVDALLYGGFPRGHLSEIHGAPSSGRTALALALLAHVTQAGSLVAWIDPGDRLDPASAQEAGADLARLLWLRGRRDSARALPEAVSAAGTVTGSGLFEAIVLDLAGLPPAALRRLPGATWLRLQRLLEAQPSAFVLLADSHVAQGPGGAALALSPAGPRWSGAPGPGRLLRALGTEVRAGRHTQRTAPLEIVWTPVV